MARHGDIRIGISGWNYPGWRGVFYPKGLAHRLELAFAAEQFRSIEINGTFYSLKRPEHFRRWFDETPDDFVFALKGSRYITHMLKLTKLEKPLANFFGSGLLRLGHKLGPVLWQLPPQFRFDPDKLANFFDQLPRTTKQAARLAKHHDHRISGRSWLRTDADRPIRHALEIRRDDFKCEAFIRLLRKHDIALVVADTVGWPLLMDVTSDFVYVRLHGSEELYASGYEDKALNTWAARVAAWAKGGDARGPHASTKPAPKAGKRDVFAYFDNDAKVRAPFDALALHAKVRQKLRLR
jgi:uncharacterized protein YecE (DUF72 family)